MFNGGLWLTRSEETNHLLRLGQTGSGKSVTAIIDRRNIYSRIQNPLLVGDPPQPEVVGGIEYDDKCENIPELCAIAGEDRVWRYNAAENAHRSHAHFQCERCSTVICLDEPRPGLRVRVPRGFVSHEIALTVKGYCAGCVHGESAKR